MLQCGDATGTGQGGPGYRFDDPEAVPGRYARGVVAMANQGTPGTNGSQFFIVHQDSEIPPDYPILGRVTEGMDVVDKVAAGVSCRGPDLARATAGRCRRSRSPRSKRTRAAPGERGRPWSW